MAGQVVTIGDATLYEGDCLEILPSLYGLDAVITDPPYSERTHSGQRTGVLDDGLERNPLDYPAWSESDVLAFVAAAAVACEGWIACMCDHVLAPAYNDAFIQNGRYAFAPIPYYAPGSRVRLSGDGPSSWTTWIVVARTAAQHRWGTLPGGYLRGMGWDAPEKMGGKPVKLMEEVIRDYSRDGQLVCDPCMGRGTTGVAALAMGRRFIGIERDAAEFKRACERIADSKRQERLFA